ncbi:MAG TPA: MoaD/ThiS family protein [Longimicrobiaceae bacterium]|nr:MoaD/ThiS family protein [Longimicrobiaceae bacterium]
MSVRVRIPMALQAYAEQRDEVEVQAATVDDALARLAERYPRLGLHLLGDDGRVRRFVSVFLNDDDVRHLGGGAAAVSSGDVVTLVPSVAGGAAPPAP